MNPTVVRSVIEFVKLSSETVDSLLGDLHQVTAEREAARSKVASVVQRLRGHNLIAANEQEEATKVASTLDGALDILDNVLSRFDKQTKQAGTSLGQGVDSQDSAQVVYDRSPERAAFGARESDQVLINFAARYGRN